MPVSSEPHKTYFCRIADLEGYRKLLTDKFISKDITHALALGHKGEHEDNAHIHIALTFAEAIKSDTLRKRFSLLFTLGKGNGHISVKKWDGNDRALSYMFHEETEDIVLSKGYSPEDIEKYKTKDQEVKADYKTNRDNSIFAHTQRVCLANANFSPAYIIRVYMLELHKRGKMYPGDYKMKNIVETIRSNNDLEKSIQEIVERIYNR